MLSPELLGGESLKKEFYYPEEYKDFIKEMEKLNETPWWLIGTSEGYFLSCYNFINIESNSNKFLIPFAKNDETNILACFDRSSRVWFCGLEDGDIKNANWNERYSMPNFLSWLDRVLSHDL